MIVKDGSFNGKLLDQLSFVAIQTPKTLKIVTVHFDASKQGGFGNFVDW